MPRNRSQLRYGRYSCDFYSRCSVWFPCYSTQLPAPLPTEVRTLSKMLESSDRNSVLLAAIGLSHSELLGFWTLSIIRYSKNTGGHNVSEAGSVSILRWGGEISTVLGPLERSNLSHWTRPLSPEDGNRSSFRNFVFYSVFRTPDEEQSPKISNSECYTPFRNHWTALDTRQSLGVPTANTAED
jgi:hypothetical protein